MKVATPEGFSGATSTSPTAQGNQSAQGKSPTSGGMGHGRTTRKGTSP